ncbi:energy-coupling factor ABC transporter permease [Herminiimonas sp. CN]|uniref:energy-coupling factor ABC transporter permease n=1 Tax=Herminiimonas sp. CN TaxID=1349818 RepID=UPI000473B57E|nr:energy-coupling factor ABC transporter permease [Herminiimonas sp. CN]
MGIFNTPLPAGIAIVAWCLAIVGMLRCAISAPWKRLEAPTVFSAWCALLILLTMLWRLRINVSSDLNLHLMGLSLFPLMFGRPLATLGLGLSVIAYTALFDGVWANLGMNFLLLALLPAWLSDVILKASKKRLPHHMFIYLFGNGFFGSMAVLSLTGLISITAHRLWIAAPAPGPSDAIAYMLLLAWGETFLIGFLVTIFAVYRPQWLFTFDDALYLHDR